MWNGKGNKENRNYEDEMKRLFDSRYNEMIEQLKEQNNMIEKQNKTIKEMQTNADEQNKKHQDQVEHYVKITENLQAQIGSIHEIQSAKISTINSNDDVFETNSAMVLSLESSEEYKRNENKIKHHTVVFDVPTMFTLVLRFIYSIMIVIVTNINLNLSSPFDKRNLSFTTAAIMAVAIILEMLGPKVRTRRTMMAYLFYAIGGMALWITYAYVDFENKQRSLWIVGIVVITAELLLVIQLILNGFPKTLIASHYFGTMAFSFLLLGFYFQSTALLIVFQVLSFSQSILALFGLPVTIRIIDQYFQHGESPDSLAASQSTQSIEAKSSTIEEGNIDSIVLNENTNNINTVASILDALHQRLESIESTLSSDTNNSLPLKNQDQDKKLIQLSSDIYTMMVFSKWKLKSYPLPYCRFQDSPVVFVIPRPSRSWLLGFVVFVTQIILGCFTLIDQTQAEENSTILQIPIRVTNTVRVGQFVSLILAIMTQTDILDSCHALLILWWRTNEWQALTDNDESETRFSVWFGRVAIPEIMKMLQGAVVFVTTFIVIIQSNDIVNLLKDFTALLIISQIDDIFFYMADIGIFGISLAKKTEDVKETNISAEQNLVYIKIAFGLLFFIVFGFWIAVIRSQMTGSFITQKYPNCNIKTFHPNIRNNVCDDAPGNGANVLDCGWEDGDCLDFNDNFPNCIDVKPFRIGDGHCDKNYYTEECKWDGGDCLKVNYPDCILTNPIIVGNGRCDEEANNEKCGFDGGECDEYNSKYPNCNTLNPSLLGNGVCVKDVNILECGYDGGDCNAFNELYPDCNVDRPFKVGDGECDGRLYNTIECGFDGGDCK